MSFKTSIETFFYIGLNKLSLVPEIAAHKGLSFFDLIEWMLKDASIKR